MAKRKPAESAAAETVVWKGPEPLRPLLIRIDDVFRDLNNVNEHDERSYADIAAAFARFGQQKPIVCDADMVVRAGNGGLEAAKRLGWTHVAVTQSDLDGVEASLYAIADNETARRSSFNQAKLADQLRKASESGMKVDDVGFSPDELKPLLEKARFVPAAGAGSSATGPDDGTPAAANGVGQGAGEPGSSGDIPDSRYRQQYGVIVVCRDEEHQREVYDEMISLGHECKVVVT